jgi:hypothetical protein
MGVHLEYALRLLGKGIVPVPLLRGGKHLDLPAMGYSPVHRESMRKELKEIAFSGICFELSQRPPSEATIAAWFEGFSGNIGIVGGANNLLILDFDDVGHFGKWRKGREALIRSTPVARSRCGFHVYLRTARPLPSTSLHFGLRRLGHAKAFGGYAVASPSALREGTAYKWLPGQSPFDLDPVRITDLAELSLRPVSPIKEIYDSILGRGYFEDA